MGLFVFSFESVQLGVFIFSLESVQLVLFLIPRISVQLAFLVKSKVYAFSGFAILAYALPFFVFFCCKTLKKTLHATYACDETQNKTAKRGKAAVRESSQYVRSSTMIPKASLTRQTRVHAWILRVFHRL